MKSPWKIAAVLAAAMPFSVLAADHSGQAYVTGNVGMAVYKADGIEAHYESQAAYYRSFAGVSASTDNDDSDVTFTLGAGYQINPYVAVEAFYRSYGEINGGVHATDNVDHVTESTNLSASGPGLGLLGMLPVTETLSLYLRADLLQLKLEEEYHYEDSLGNPPQNSAADDSNVTAGVGVGGQYDFGEGYAMRVDYQHIRGKLTYFDGSTNKGDINSFSLGVLKLF